MPEHATSSDQDIPRKFPDVTPDMMAGAGQLRLIIGGLEKDIREIKDNVTSVTSSRHSDFKYVVSILGCGFLLLAGMLVFGYFKLDDKIESKMKQLGDKIEPVLINTTKTDTKLDDLLQRIPPAVVPAPKR